MKIHLMFKYFPVFIQFSKCAYVSDFKMVSQDVQEERVTLCIPETNIETVTAFSITYKSNDQDASDNFLDKTQTGSTEELTAKCIELYDSLKRSFTATGSFTGTISEISYTMTAGGTFCTSESIRLFMILSINYFQVSGLQCINELL